MLSLPGRLQYNVLRMIKNVSVCPQCKYTTTPSSTASTNLTLQDIVHKRKPLKLWQMEGVMKPVPTELLLLQTLLELFPEHRPKYKVKKEVNLINPKTKRPLEADIWFPTLGLYFEYQDPHHYRTMWFSHRTLEDVQELDNIKKDIITKKGETMIQVPCWWDGQKESLIATIKAARPDLLQNQHVVCDPIPADVPPNFFRNSAVSDIGELMIPSFFSAARLKRALSSKKWWMQEKYDGFRCCWDPVKRMFFSRAGHPIQSIPDNLKDQMPDEYLDGELWFGYGSFQEAAKLNPQYKACDVDWNSFKFIAFDIPNPKYIADITPFEERHKKLIEVVGHSHPFIKIEPIEYVKDEAHLMAFVNEVIQKGGEGVIIRQRGSPYTHGRSEYIGKLKIMRDEDAIVTEIDTKTGKCLLELPEGTTFNAPLPKAEDFSGPLPKVGDVVSFTFKHFMRGNLPADPHIQRIRTDLSWDEVKAKKSHRFYLNVHKDYSRRWTGDKTAVRGHLEQFAQDNGFDPLVPENWYKVQLKDIKATPGASSMLEVHYQSSLIKALVDQFPEIGLDVFKFKYLPKNFFSSKENFKAFAIQVAKKHGFDPLVADNWYKFPYSIVTQWRAIVKDLPFPVQLTEAFPEVKFDLDKFTSSRNFYSDTKNVRAFLIRLAADRGFDPLVAENWYNFPFSTIKQQRAITKDAPFPLKLAEAFPEVKFDMNNFKKMPVISSPTSKDVRSRLLQFAKRNGFDPLNPNNWYNISLQTTKELHSKSFPAQLAQAFPEVKFNMENFNLPKTNISREQKREVFLSAAKQLGFDPFVAENWYTITAHIFRRILGTREIMNEYGGFRIALVDLFPELKFDVSRFRSKFPYASVPR